MVEKEFVKYRITCVVFALVCVSSSIQAQTIRQDGVPVLRPAIKDDGSEDFTVGEVKGTVKTSAVFLPKPSYADEARQAGAEGSVRVRITVDAEGNVTNAVVESGDSQLRPSAEAAARRSKFRIARNDAGEPIQVEGGLIYYYEIRPAGWIRIGSGLSSIQRFPISSVSIPMIRKAFDPQWTHELRLLEKLEEIRRAEPPAAKKPTLVSGTVINSGTGGFPGGRGTASQSVSGTLILPPPATVEQAATSQELIAALRERVKSDTVRSWQFELGTSLFVAFDLFRDPRQRQAAADTVLRFIQNKPDGVSDEVLAALRTLESRFRDGNRAMDDENAISSAMRVLMKAR